ncbi:hypothetical protein DAI22_03g386100 [Oryza sativa Japonica Group]|nr:hypothetical protein DAI22_03g386100 [Oryza sativa Japonica Group]
MAAAPRDAPKPPTKKPYRGRRGGDVREETPWGSRGRRERRPSWTCGSPSSATMAPASPASSPPSPPGGSPIRTTASPASCHPPASPSTTSPPASPSPSSTPPPGTFAAVVASLPKSSRLRRFSPLIVCHRRVSI